MKAGKTFEKGHFKKHNDEVVAKIRSKQTVKEGFDAFLDAACDDAILLVDAGASQEQMKASIEALRTQGKVEGWAAIVANT